MSEHPIIFSGPMVRAILAGLMTQTRRVIKPQPPIWKRTWTTWNTEDVFLWTPRNPLSSLERAHYVKCPYAPPGDTLWVREAWRVGAWNEDNEIAVDYKADGYARREWLVVEKDSLFERLWIQSMEDAKSAGFSADEEGNYWEYTESPCRWRPSIHMPRWACRLSLKVENIRAERAQDISEEDAEAEGVDRESLQGYVATGTDQPHRLAFADLWNKINAKRGYGWDVNPWVWVIEFSRQAASDTPAAAGASHPEEAAR